MAEVSFPSKMGRPVFTVSTGKTLAATDCGTVQNVTVDGLTLTLPAAAAGLVGVTFIVRNGGTGADVGFTIAPNSADGVNGLGFTSVVNKGVINTKATSRPGDEIEITCSGVTGTAAWSIVRAHGTFARVA